MWELAKASLVCRAQISCETWTVTKRADTAEVKFLRKVGGIHIKASN
jgi:hypothetical protein